MNTEEKAKAYDKAVKEASIAYKDEDRHLRATLERIFPELKESEDEKIRKALLNYLKKMWGNCKDNVCGIHVEDAIAWLEKHGEQKSKKVSIWKHWKNGIAGNGEGKQIFLTKFNNTYKLSSYLNSECDYIELSELDNLLLEKQGETFTKKDVDDAYLKGVNDTKNEFEKQGEKPQGKSALETWKIMRFEVYQQASGNRHEPNCSDDTTKMFSLNDIDEIFEKICEQKTSDKVEPKFKVGDWIANDYCAGKVIALTDDAYLLDTGQGIPFSYEHNVHRWTIEDAKAGDVLIASDESIFIYAGSTDRYAKFHLALTKCGKLNVDGGNWEDKNSVHPATKEQRDALFTKMKEAGYEWNDTKKELKKLDDEEVNGEDYGIDGLWHAQRILEKTLGSVDGYQTDDGILDHKAAITAVKKLYKQKNTWSAEDEQHINSLLKRLDGLCRNEFERTRFAISEDIDWLKSLKKRIGG